MSFLQTLFFESPFRLGIFCFLLFAVVLLVRRRWTGNWQRYSLPATVALIVLLFALQYAVTTQRERILQSMETLIAAVEHKDVSAIRGVFSPAYESEEMNQEAIVSTIGSMLRGVTVKDTRISRSDIEIEGDRARLDLGVRATVSIHGAIGEFHTGRWRIEWRREGDAWQIVSLRPEMIDAVPIESMRALGGYVP